MQVDQSEGMLQSFRKEITVALTRVMTVEIEKQMDLREI